MISSHEAVLYKTLIVAKNFFQLGLSALYVERSCRTLKPLHSPPSPPILAGSELQSPPIWVGLILYIEE
jgi:hypothetical protein